MIVPAITLILFLAVALGMWTLAWQLDIATRFMAEDVAYSVRVATRQPMPTQDDYLEAVQIAMLITCRRYEDRLEQFVAERVVTFDAVDWSSVPLGVVQ